MQKRADKDGTDRCGFTLVEMLIVIVIIGVLAGLLLPVVSRIRGSARSTECRNNLRQMHTALELYRNANDGYYPYAALLPSEEKEGRPRLRDVLENSAGSPRVFRCPCDGNGYYEREGTSYEYNVRLGGQRVLRGRFAEVMGSTRVPVFYDYEEFHGGPGQPGARNFVFVDGHVGTSSAFDVEEEEEEPTP